MTQHDRLQEVARLTQRQDQLERQHRETSAKVDAIKRDVAPIPQIRLHRMVAGCNFPPPWLWFRWRYCRP